MEKKNSHFLLQYKNILVGVLTYEDDYWIFKYSDDFKKQSLLFPLINFPDLDKNYTSKILWPFFKCRIPDVNNPFIKDKHKNLREFSELKMLIQYGKHTISNPFILKYEV